MADWWMLSGTTSTAAGAGGPVMVGQSAEITDLEIASCAIGSAELANSSVTSGKIADGAVLSQKASANLQRRSVAVMAGSTSGTGFSSTSLALWTAPTPITLSAIKVTPLAAWTVATCGTDVLQFWSCSAGIICAYCTSSTELCSAIGVVNSCFALKSSGLNLAACETMRLAVTVPGTTACAQPALFQIDYVTTG